MEIKKQWVNTGKTVFDGQVKAGCDGSIIVPDVKPDIIKVLQVDANTYLCDKTCEQGKITLSGKVLITVLYIPEEERDKICSIRTSFDFCEVIKNAEFTDDMQILATCDAQKVTYKLINSRKLGIEAQVVIDLQAVRENSFECVEALEGDDAECMHEEICIEAGGIYKEHTFNMEESFSLLGVREILKENVQIRDKEYKALSDKVVVKGKAVLEALYLDEDGKTDHFSRELPFTEVVEMAGISEDAECDITFEPREVSVVCDEQDGIRVNFDIGCFLKGENEQRFTALTDCYFTDAVEELEYTDICGNETVARPRHQATLKEIITKKDTMPEISGVYSAVAKPLVESVKIQDGKILVKGSLLVYVLYTAENSQMPICSISENLPFNYAIACDNLTEDCDILLKGECEHISAVILSGEAVEIRCGLLFCGRVVRKKCLHILSDAKKGECVQGEKGILVYFVKKGDCVWDVAKKYRISQKCVMDAIGDMDFCQGMKLVIPISK